MKKVGLEHRNRGETVEPSEHIKDQDRRFEQFYESNLYLDNVRSEHYTSVFRCEASNKYGTDYHDIGVKKIFKKKYFFKKLLFLVKSSLKLGTSIKLFLHAM